MKLAPSPQFQPVQEWNNAFLALWPHRYDYLWAEHPNPGERPDWKTESRHPLNDRLIQQGAYLYGVRFGPTTRYCVLDIDRGSIYHPTRDRFAGRRMVAALESLGLVQAVFCTSSYSGGLHLYFPFEEEHKTWEIALAVSTLLEAAGFKLAPGQLEVFPNCKPYSASGEPSLYHGHRLPMQAGSYLLNEDFQQVWGDQHTFVQHWQFARQRNSISTKAIDRIIKAARRRQFRITNKADKFLNDLNAEIEQGWTSSGQTNRLLGRIAMRSYIFGHVLYADTPLEGNALVQDIITVARSLPGYEDWCGHQHELEQRAKDWVASIEHSRYFHYGTPKPPSELDRTDEINLDPTRNQQKQLEARNRIRQAVADLLEKGSLPAGITERFDALISYSISGSTLYRHRDLWHPRHLQQEPDADFQGGQEQGCQGEAPCSCDRPNLLERNECNSLPGASFSDSLSSPIPEIGCNTFAGEALSQLEPRNMSQEEGIAHVKQVLEQVRMRRQAEKLQKDKGLGRSPDPTRPPPARSPLW